MNTGAGTTARATQITAWMLKIDESLNELDSAVALIEDKTSVVSMQNPPVTETVKGLSQPEECLVSLADQLRNFVKRVDGMRLRLRGLAGRIEL
jgi:hypothetical protein